MRSVYILRWVLMAVLAATLTFAVMACGSAEEPAPAPTTEDMAAAIQQAMAAQQPGVTAEDMAAAIQQAMAAQQPGVTTEDVASEISKALRAQPGGVTSEEMAAAIQSAMQAQQPGVTTEDVASEISKALRAQPGGVTSQEMAAAISGALAEQPGVTTGDVAEEIAKALRAQPGGVTEEQMAMAIESALKAQPGVSQEDIQMAVESAVESAVGAALEARQASDEALARAVSATAPIVANPNGKYGGTLNLGDYVFPNLAFAPYEEPGTLHKNIAPIYGGLIGFNGETEDIWDIRGDLADSWVASPDLKKYAFTINTNATWHDGKPVTAEDVAWSLNHMLEPSPAIRPTNHLLKTYLPHGGARALDSRTVQLNLGLASAEFLPVFAMSYHFLYQRDYVEATLADGGDFTWEDQMGFGPFTPGEKVNDVSFELFRNENYYKEGIPYVDRIKNFNLPEGPSMIAAFATGQIHANSMHQITPYSNAEALQLQMEHGDKVTVEFFAPNGPVGLIMSVQPPFDDVRMRQAFNLAFDRHEFVEVFGAGPGTDAIGGWFGADTFFGFTTAEYLEMPGFRQGPMGEKHPDDIAEAKRLIAEWEADHPDGFTNEVGTDHYTYTPGEGHSFTTMTRISSNKVAWAELAVEQLNRFLDIDGAVIPIDSAAGIERYFDKSGPGGAGSYFFAGQDQGLMMLPNILTSTIMNLNPATGWQTLMPEWFYDAHEAQKIETDPEKRVELIRKMQRFLIEEDPGPLLTLYQQSNSVTWSKKLKNFNMPPNHYANMMWEQVWLDE